MKRVELEKQLKRLIILICHYEKELNRKKLKRLLFSEFSKKIKLFFNECFQNINYMHFHKYLLFMAFKECYGNTR